MFGQSNGTDRDALRRALNVSLHDVLRDVAVDTASVPANRDMSALFASHQQHQHQQQHPTPQLQLASRHIVFPPGMVPNAPMHLGGAPMGAPVDHQYLSAAMLNEQRFLQQARTALTKQRLIAEEKKRQMLLEENKNRLLQHSYMAYLQEKMAAKGTHEVQGAMQGAQANSLALMAFQGNLQGNLQGNRMAPNSHNPAMKAPPAQNIDDPLAALGTTLRKVDDPYVDVSQLKDTKTEVDPSQRKARGGVQVPFPEKLHAMLRELEEQGKTDIVSFYSHGRAFGVHDPDRFVEEIMPNYFKMGKWNSFARQLNLYGFVRITTGPDAGGYYHELFLNGRPKLCVHMRRVGVPQGADRRKNKAKNQTTDPDFYTMKPVS
jgi:hypothetical protein